MILDLALSLHSLEDQSSFESWAKPWLESTVHCTEICEAWQDSGPYTQCTLCNKLWLVQNFWQKKLQDLMSCLDLFGLDNNSYTANYELELICCIESIVLNIHTLSMWLCYVMMRGCMMVPCPLMLRPGPQSERAGRNCVPMTRGQQWAPHTSQPSDTDWEGPQVWPSGIMGILWGLYCVRGH